MLEIAYLHQVRSYTRSIAATTLFTENVDNTFNNTGCYNELVNEYHSMDDIQFHWTYEIGDQTIDMGYMNVERLRHVLIDKITDEEIFPGGYWNFKRFRIFYKSFAYGGAQLSAKEAWNDVLKLKDNSKIRVPDIQRFTRQQLKLLARALDPPHGPKTDGYEKVSIVPGMKWLRHGVEEDDDENDGDNEQKNDNDDNEGEQEKEKSNGRGEVNEQDKEEDEKSQREEL